ncbi:hypothetical protein [Micromonospora carbonacea]
MINWVVSLAGRLRGAPAPAPAPALRPAVAVRLPAGPPRAAA